MSIKALLVFMIDRFRLLDLLDLVGRLVETARISRYERVYACTINYYRQGHGSLEISGRHGSFFIDHTSHLKSGSFIECSGGVRIGKYVHTGRGLTVFSTSHTYEGGAAIPYDGSDIVSPVVVEDFVWIGANVTIVPGVTLGEGCVVGAGSVVTKPVPRCAVVGGSPAKVLKYRDLAHFEALKARGAFY